MKPPSLRVLLEDPIYRKYVKTVPRLDSHLSWGDPWQVWGRTVEGSWRTKKFHTYQDAWPMVVKCVKNKGTYEDVSLVSRRLFFPPPEGFHWDRFFSWCSRCRRPSSFRIRPKHHAMRNVPVMTTDDPMRCYFCGIRRVMMPEYHS